MRIKQKLSLAFAYYFTVWHDGVDIVATRNKDYSTRKGLSFYASQGIPQRLYFDDYQPGILESQ